MQFEEPLLEGTFLGRPKKYVASILLTTGEEVAVHCANRGSLAGCLEPGNKVLISPQSNPRIKHNFQLEIVYAGKTPIAVHAGRPSGVLAEAIMAGKLRELAGYATLHRDNRAKRECRVDLVVKGNDLRPCYIRVENVTLAQEGIALFPDTTIPDVASTMYELTGLVREGNRAMVIFLVQRADVNTFRLADHIDSEFTAIFRDTVARGVEVGCYRSKVTRKGIELDAQLPMDLGDR